MPLFNYWIRFEQCHCTEITVVRFWVQIEEEFILHHIYSLSNYWILNTAYIVAGCVAVWIATVKTFPHFSQQKAMTVPTLIFLFSDCISFYVGSCRYRTPFCKCMGIIFVVTAEKGIQYTQKIPVGKIGIKTARVMSQTYETTHVNLWWGSVAGKGFSTRTGGRGLVLQHIHRSHSQNDEERSTVECQSF